jgi:probable F420-dependent oxidoreductase
MKLSWGGFEGTRNMRDLSARIEELGFDSVGAVETRHDPFVQSAVMIEHTRRVEVMTTIAVAFARTPMLLAYAAHDLNSLSGGRFILGLGSQTKAHIVRRFAMPWSQPAERMREMIRATHAIWDNWYDGKPLAFDGQFYSHTLMTPNFTPTDIEHGRPPIHLAAVGPHMTEVAAELAQGLICHSFTTERYVREVTLPAIEASLARHGRKRGDFEITGTQFIATGHDDKTLAKAVITAKRQIAFYGSTPAYMGVLEMHGWGDLHRELHRLSKRGEWEEMGRLIDDDVLNTFAIVGPPKQAAAELKRRFEGVFDRVSLGMGNNIDAAAELIGALRG